MNKQHGFSFVSILIIIGALGLIALIGWRIYDANTSSKTQQPVATPSQNGSNDTQIATTPLSQVYTSKLGKFTLEYPNEWSKKDESNGNNEAVVLSSPDVVTSSPAIGGVSVEKGATINVAVSPCEEKCNIQTGVYNDFYDKITTNRSTVTVDGEQAARYEWAYESQPTMTTKFFKDNYVYTIWFNTGGNDFNNEYRAAYDTAISSFRFTQN